MFHVEHDENLFDNVPRGTLEKFASLLLQWKNLTSLVSYGSIKEIWERHIEDSMHLMFLIEAFITQKPNQDKQEKITLLDLGSGSGFPGIILSLLDEKKKLDIHLVDASLKKCLFLEMAAYELGLSLQVHHARIEALPQKIQIGVIRPPSLITARALAPLPKLFSLSYALFGPSTVGLFMKGQRHKQEIEEAKKDWSFQYSVHIPQTKTGVILATTHLCRR